MIDRENVTQGLWCCTHTGNCLICPYDIKGGREYDENGNRCLENLINAAYEVLEAQEPIEVRLHLCESCTKRYPDCNSDYIEFGCGFGNDNVIGCDAYTNRWVADHDCQRDYEAATEMTEYCERYESTYNPEDGSM